MQEFLSLFKFNFEDWGITMDLTPWKTNPYSKLGPRKKSPNGSMPGFGHADFPTKESDRGHSIVATRIAKPSGGMTPVYEHMDLHYPIAAGNVAMVKWCLENGADANYFAETSNYKSYKRVGVLARSPLLLVVQDVSLGDAPRVAIASLLLKYDADPNQEETKGETPLLLAIKGGHSALVELLLASDRIDLNRNLCWALRKEQWAVVKLLLDIERTDPDFKDSSLRTPLSWASESGPKAIVEQLLANNRVSPESKDEAGRTPLSWAASGGHATAVKLLLANDRINPDSKDNRGRTPLSWASASRSWVSASEPWPSASKQDTVVGLLLASDRVDPDSKDNCGRTPLSWASAAREDHEAAVILLADDRVDPDSKDNYDRTPLSFASEFGRRATVERLLANIQMIPDVKDKSGKTPLFYAVCSNQSKVVELLLKDDLVHPDSKDQTGRTPLSYAVEFGHGVVIRQLLATSRVSLRAKDQNFLTPLSWLPSNHGDNDSGRIGALLAAHEFR